MTKKVMIFTSSARPAGNSESLAIAFANGAKQARNDVTLVHLREKNISFCKGCLLCQSIGKCMTEDDMAQLLEQMRVSDVIAFASPIYFYEMCGRLKTFLDRTLPLYSANNQFTDIYFLASAAETSPKTMDRAISGLTGWIDCFPKTTLKGVVRACGVNDITDIKGSLALKQAFEMGEKC